MTSRQDIFCATMLGRKTSRSGCFALQRHHLQTFTERRDPVADVDSFALQRMLGVFEMAVAF